MREGELENKYITIRYIFKRDGRLGLYRCRQVSSFQNHKACATGVGFAKGSRIRFLAKVDSRSLMGGTSLLKKFGRYTD